MIRQIAHRGLSKGRLPVRHVFSASSHDLITLWLQGKRVQSFRFLPCKIGRWVPVFSGDKIQNGTPLACSVIYVCHLSKMDNLVNNQNNPEVDTARAAPFLFSSTNKRHKGATGLCTRNAFFFPIIYGRETHIPHIYEPPQPALHAFLVGCSNVGDL